MRFNIRTGIREMEKLGLESPAAKLASRLFQNHERAILESARSFIRIGATVNSSFYDCIHTRQEFYNDEIENAFRDLGLLAEKVPGRKWYQFWLNNDQVHLINCLKVLQKGVDHAR